MSGFITIVRRPGGYGPAFSGTGPRMTQADWNARRQAQLEYDRMMSRASADASIQQPLEAAANTADARALNESAPSGIALTAKTLTPDRRAVLASIRLDDLKFLGMVLASGGAMPADKKAISDAQLRVELIDKLLGGKE